MMEETSWTKGHYAVPLELPYKWDKLLGDGTDRRYSQKRKPSFPCPVG